MRYFFYGGEDFLIWQEVNRLRNKFIRENPKAEIKNFDLEESIPITDVLKEIQNSGNLFSYKKIVVIKNISFLKKEAREKFLDFFQKNEKSLQNNEILIVDYQKNKRTASGNLTKYLIKNFQSREFKKMNQFEITNWLKKEIAQRSGDKIKINDQQVNQINVYCQGNLWKINNEVEKVINYQETGILDSDKLEEIIFGDEELKIFDLIDAIGYKDKKRALTLLNKFLKKGENAFYLLSMISFQFRNLAKLIKFRNSVLVSNQIAQKTGLHPFVVKKNLEQLRKYSSQDIKRAYQILADMDYHSKIGEEEKEQSLVNLVLSI